ncbi:MAG: 2-amino-4-hydroxy-6-hydroxymethyldihydropteridine diphosphokinase [Bacteroidota bacterium]
MFTFASILVKLNQVYLSLGSNVGNRTAMLQEAISLLSEVGEVEQISSFYETAAWGKTEQPAFLNLVLLMQTNLRAINFMQELIAIESRMGRIRNEKWEARMIDIDILFFNHEVINEKHLHVPHPFLQQRKFVLEPLAEIAPHFVHPVLKLEVLQLLKNCADTLSVNRLAHA